MEIMKLDWGENIPSRYTGIVIWSKGQEKWHLKNGIFHRKDGPAIECVDGTKSWFLNGKLHREDGLAIEHVNGTKEYWLNGKLICFDKIQELLDLEYPIEAAIKIAFFLEMKK